jgi:hypothetical protein
VLARHFAVAVAVMIVDSWLFQVALPWWREGFRAVKSAIRLRSTVGAPIEAGARTRLSATNASESAAAGDALKVGAASANCESRLRSTATASLMERAVTAAIGTIMKMRTAQTKICRERSWTSKSRKQE